MEELNKALFSEDSDPGNSDLKCSICNKCLSVPPIIYNDIFGSICGRTGCSALSRTKGNNSEQLTYQSFAKYFKFPCMYRDNGCQAELEWGEVVQHEGTCAYKNLICPLSKEDYLKSGEEHCDWMGDSSEFLNHLQESHEERSFLNSLELSFQRDYNECGQTGEIFFTKIQEEIVVVLLFMNNQKSALFCNVWAGVSIFKDLQYKIKIFGKNNNDSVAYSKENIKLLAPNFLNNKLRNSINLDFNYLKNHLDKPNSIVIQFKCNGITVGTLTECQMNNLQQESCINLNLREGRCDNCTEELNPPIFLCPSGHKTCSVCKVGENSAFSASMCPKCPSEREQSSRRYIGSCGSGICDNCKRPSGPRLKCFWGHNICSLCNGQKTNEFNFNTCPKCPSEMKTSRFRNSAYEKLKFLIDQSCKNYVNGCQYKGPYPLIQEHEKMCHVNSQKCILGCSQKLHNLFQHLKSNHALAICALDYLYSLNFLKPYIFLYDDHIFVFNIKLGTDSSFSFNIQCLETKAVKYKYKLHLMNNKFLNSEILLSHICHPELFVFNENETGLSKDMFIPYYFWQQIFPDSLDMQFKISISKI